MAVLVGLCLGALLLYRWLCGGWFAQVLTFICIMSVVLVLVAVDASGGANSGSVGTHLFIIAVSAWFAWFGSRVPMVRRNRQARAMVLAGTSPYRG